MGRVGQKEDECMSAFLYFLRNHGFVKSEFVLAGRFSFVPERGILSVSAIGWASKWMANEDGNRRLRDKL